MITIKKINYEIAFHLMYSFMTIFTVISGFIYFTAFSITSWSFAIFCFTPVIITILSLYLSKIRFKNDKQKKR